MDLASFLELFECLSLVESLQISGRVRTVTKPIYFGISSIDVSERSAADGRNEKFSS